MEQTSQKKPYVCPPDAGPAWRAAYEAGIDMAELEENLRLTPEERLEKHQRMLDAHFERERLLEKLIRGQQFIQKLHVHSRHSTN
jgi:hypothetical protein